MRYLLCSVSLASIVAAALGCSGGGPPLPEDVFVEVTIELHLVDALTTSESVRTSLRDSVFAKYDMPAAAYEASVAYYAAHTDEYSSVYSRVIDELASERSSLRSATPD